MLRCWVSNYELYLLIVTRSLIFIPVRSDLIIVLKHNALDGFELGVYRLEKTFDPSNIKDGWCKNRHIFFDLNHSRVTVVNKACGLIM